MNRNGFTLVELVATIALLAVIAIISFVSINGVINQSKVSNCNDLVNNIKSATKKYISDNRYNLKTIGDDIYIGDFQIKKENEVEYIEINGTYLVDKNYLSGSIINPFAKEESEKDVTSSVTIRVELNNDYTVSNGENSILIKNASNNVIDCDSGKW